MLYLRKKKEYNKKRFIAASLISIPAFLYSAWAVTGLGRETIIWGAILLSAGVPIFTYMKLKQRKE
jgi:hypothetical protein